MNRLRRGCAWILSLLAAGLIRLARKVAPRK